MIKILKRVPVDFVVKDVATKFGDIFVCSDRCPDCEGQGSTQARQTLGRMFLALKRSQNSIDSQLLSITQCEQDPSMKEVFDAVLGDKASNDIMIQNVIFSEKSIEAYLQAIGLSPRWGVCESCGGSGIINDYIEYQEPPTGDGFQLWVDEHELLPITPVFRTPEGLSVWCANNIGECTGDEWLSKIKGAEISKVGFV